MHFESCSRLDEESHSSRDLVDEVFSLRVNRPIMSNDRLVRAVVTADVKDEAPQKSKLMYHIQRSFFLEKGVAESRLANAKQWSHSGRCGSRYGNEEDEQQAVAPRRLSVSSLKYRWN